MKDKKQIEEMVQDIEYAMQPIEYGIGEVHYPTKEEIAEIFFKKGYRKIPKNAVVIPEKITEEISATDLIKIAKYNDEIRKKTAREILEYLLRSFFLTDKHKFFVKKWVKEQYKLEEEL